MQYLLHLLVLSVEAGLVVGTPIEGILASREAQNEVRKQNSILDVVASCGNSFNLFTTVSPDPAAASSIPASFDYLSFCAAYNQPTKTFTSISYVPTTLTVKGTATTVTAVTTTTTTALGSSGTATVTCPIPAPSMICGQGGWGYAANNIYSASGIDATTCHELCLANTACQSFQVDVGTVTNPSCNLYKVDPSGNNTIVSSAAPFAFFARDCPDHLPAACGSGVAPSSSPVVTAVPPPTSSPVVIVPPPTRRPDAPFVERAEAEAVEAVISVPWFLQPFGAVTMSEICSCIYTQDIPATTIVAVIPKATSVYVSIPGTVVTAFVTTVVTVSGGGGGGGVTSIA